MDSGGTVAMVMRKAAYVVGTCRRTLDVLHWGWGVHGLWTPTYVMNTPRGKGRVCAMPGYIFVPADSWAVCLGVAPPFFALHILSPPSDPRPYTVALSELLDMEATLRSLTGPGATAPAYVPSEGDMVRLLCAPFTGMCGVVERVRNTTARVLVGTKFVTVDHNFLQLELNEDL